MAVVAFDTETALIRPALLAPPLVCVTSQQLNHAACIEHHSTAESRIRSWLEDPNTIIVGHNVAYDLAVIAERFPDLRLLIFKAYDEDRVTDTQIRQQLIDIAAGCYRGSVSAKGKRIVFEYTLEALAKRCANFELQKDEWRLSYGNFIDTPLADWPVKARQLQTEARVRLAEILARVEYGDEASPEQIASLVETVKKAEPLTAPKFEDKELAKRVDGLVSMINGDPDRCRTYPLDDARATLLVWQAQEKHAAYLKDQYRQARAAFALHLNSAWGLRTDPTGVAQLRKAIEADLADIEDELVMLGLIRPDGSRDTKVAKKRMIEVCAREGIPVVRTDAHFEEKLTWEERVARAAAEPVPDGKKPKKPKPRCKALDGTPLDDGHDDCAEHVCLDGDACDRSNDDVLIDYAERTTFGKQLSNDIPALEKGTQYPVHTRYGLAGTGRSTSSKPNIQNQSKRAGFREAFVPRGYAA